MARARGSARREFTAQWRSLLGATIGTSLGVAAYPVYVAPIVGLRLESELGWTRQDVALLSTALIVGALLGAPIAGRLVDTCGVRGPAVASMLLMSAVLATAVVAPGDATLWRFGAVAFGLLGAASLPITYSRAICDRFMAARGLALGITFGGLGLAGALLPLALDRLIDTGGIDGALACLAGAYALIVAPLIAVLLQDQDPSRQAEEQGRTTVDRAAARGNGALPWAVLSTLGFAFLLMSVAVTGGATHLGAWMQDARAGTPTTAAAALATTVLVTRPCVGALIDRVFAPWVAAATFVLAATGLIALSMIGPGVALPAAIVLGVAIGTEIDVMSYLVSRYVPAEVYGRTFSALYVIMVIGIAIGPPLYGYLHAILGSYRVPYLLAGGVTLVAAALLLLLPRYSRYR